MNHDIRGFAVARDVRRDIEVTDEEADDIGGGVEGAVSAGAILVDLDDAIEFCGDGSGLMVLHKSEDVVEMPLQGAGEGAHRGDVASQGGGHPDAQELLCGPLAGEDPEPGAFVLEHPGAIERFGSQSGVTIMRYLVLLGVAGAVAALATLSRAAIPAPRPLALWQKVQALRKAHALMLESAAYQPGSRTVDTYTIDLANRLANDAIRKAGGISKVRRYPDGALVVKENFNVRRQLTGITAMLKLPDYDAADRNWVMAAYTPASKAIAYGKVPACIACHTLVSKQDFVFAPPPKQLLSVAIWKAFFPKQPVTPAYAQLLRWHPANVVK